LELPALPDLSVTASLPPSVVIPAPALAAAKVVAEALVPAPPFREGAVPFLEEFLLNSAARTSRSLPPRGVPSPQRSPTPRGLPSPPPTAPPEKKRPAHRRYAKTDSSSTLSPSIASMASTAVPSAARTPSAATPTSCSGCTAFASSASTAGSTPTHSEMVNSIGGAWRKGDELGSGAFGSVYMAQDAETGFLFAVKVSRTVDNSDQDRKYSEKLQHELDICRGLRHRHIVTCLGHEYVDCRLHIFLEYVAGGSLRRMLDRFGPFDDRLLRKAVQGLLEGLDFLHTHSPPVVHRDLKGANVLVDQHFCVKLADFGCSKCDVNTQSFTSVGTVCWMAPEVVMQEGGHGRKADIWSLGCVVIEMATAADPWGKGVFDNWMHAFNVIRSPGRMPPIPDTLSDTSQDLVRCCLQRSPEERPCASQLLRHDMLLQVQLAGKDAGQIDQPLAPEPRGAPQLVLSNA